ncbi:MAG TPA: ribosome silencing factor [Clostridiaceae bacterium]|nr:ribosome silencing factor [Clostridiaceae bacterium]
MNSEKLVQRIVEILKEKKAKNIDIINIKEISILADYFVICSGTSNTHIKTLADELELKLSETEGRNPDHKEGYASARWILLDYGDVVVHIFREEDRNFYNLERLWSDGILTMVDN